MKLKLDDTGRATVTETTESGVREWTTYDRRHTALHAPTWDHRDAKRSQLAPGDRSALADLANEHAKQRGS